MSAKQQKESDKYKENPYIKSKDSDIYKEYHLLERSKLVLDNDQNKGRRNLALDSNTAKELLSSFDQ